MLESLKEAVSLSPQNIPLRLSLAELLVKENNYDEAIVQYKEVLNLSYGNRIAQLGLASCYFHKGQHSAAIIIFEQYEADLEPRYKMLYIYALVKENNLAKASPIYQEITDLDPGYIDPDLDSMLKMPSTDPFAGDDEWDEDDMPEWWDFEIPKLTFDDVGGMEKVKKEISMKIIKPLLHPELYKAYGKKTGGGILLYGPPGCGKTYLARATAGEIQGNFISIGLNNILDMWIGNSEKNLHEVFETARMRTPCVVFIDEVDALGASRADLRQSAMRHTINQFLAEMDGVNSNNEGVLVLAATNAPWSVDGAFRRPGRFDKIIFVPPPDEESRASILKTQLSGKLIDKIDYKKIASLTPEFSGADLASVIDVAVEAKLEESIENGTMLPLTTRDLMQAAKQVRPSTKEWFATARNYALYSNESGQYNDILDYINKKK